MLHTCCNFNPITVLVGMVDENRFKQVRIPIGSIWESTRLKIQRTVISAMYVTENIYYNLSTASNINQILFFFSQFCVGSKNIFNRIRI